MASTTATACATAHPDDHDHAVNRRLESDQQGYEKWVNRFATGLGDRPAVVILEPDALAQLNSCLDNAQQHARLQMLSYAVKTLQTKSYQVYLDAGHLNWVPAGQMAGRLRAADVARAYGFALNVSNFGTTDREIGYATELDRNLGMAKRFVVDTSRNGKGSAGGRVHPAAGSISQALPGAGGGALASRLFTAPDSQAAYWIRAHPRDPRAQEIRQRIANRPPEAPGASARPPPSASPRGAPGSASPAAIRAPRAVRRDWHDPSLQAGDP
jgi:glycosyl hydrolase family 6